MSASFTIHPNLGLMIVRYRGTVSGEDGINAFRAYVAHPDYAPGQTHLVDFSQVSEFDSDYAKVMELQAIMADTIMAHRTPTMFVYCAPTEISQTLCQHSISAWQSVAHVVVRVLDSEQDVLDVLGLQDQSFDSLLQGVS